MSTEPSTGTDLFAPSDQDPTAPTTPWPLGSRVTHKTLGTGTVENYVGSGETRIIRVKFDTHGDKELMLQFAASSFELCDAPAAEPHPLAGVMTEIETALKGGERPWAPALIRYLAETYAVPESDLALALSGNAAFAVGSPGADGQPTTVTPAWLPLNVAELLAKIPVGQPVKLLDVVEREGFQEAAVRQAIAGLSYVTVAEDGTITRQEAPPEEPKPEAPCGGQIPGQAPALASSPADQLNALRTNKEDMQKVAERLAQLQAEEASLKDELRGVRKKIEKAVDRLAELARADAMQTSIFNGEEDKDADPGQVNPFEQGHQAFTAGKPITENPYGADQEARASKWLEGFKSAEKAAANPVKPDDHTRSLADFAKAMGMENHPDPAKVVSCHGLPDLAAEHPEGKPIKIEPLTAWETTFLASPGDAAKGHALTLIPVHSLDTWKSYYAEHQGEAWKFGKRGADAPNKLDHGEACGLTVKNGRSHMIVGSIKDAVFIALAVSDAAAAGTVEAQVETSPETGAGPEEVVAPEAEGATGKEAAAGV